MSKPANVVNPNEIKTRDWNMVALINGSTKSGFQKNRKHDANKKACRGKFKGEW